MCYTCSALSVECSAFASNYWLFRHYISARGARGEPRCDRMCKSRSTGFSASLTIQCQSFNNF